LASGQTHNTFECRVQRTVDSRFERMVLLEASPGAPQSLQWRFNRFTFEDEEQLQRGETVRIHIPESRIYLVTA
jgi:hypothetical protein